MSYHAWKKLTFDLHGSNEGAVQNAKSITYSVLISPCFALDPYEKQQLIKPELVIELQIIHWKGTFTEKIHLSPIIYLSCDGNSVFEKRDAEEWDSTTNSWAKFNEKSHQTIRLKKKNEKKWVSTTPIDPSLVQTGFFFRPKGISV